MSWDAFYAFCSPLAKTHDSQRAAAPLEGVDTQGVITDKAYDSYA
jgi:hypothetical protein